MPTEWLQKGSEMYAFEYERATDQKHAVKKFESYDAPRYLAGGQTLLASMKMRLAQPDALIDLGRVASLKEMNVDPAGISLGAMVSHSTIAQSHEVQQTAPWLSDLAKGIGDRMVRHRGTLGGSLANSDPAADWPAAALALEATIVTDRREIAATDFFQGMFMTALEPSELIVAVRFPQARRAAYAKFRNPASRYAVVGVFVAELQHGVRVAVTGAGPCVFRVPEMEQALVQSFQPSSIEGLHPLFGDLNNDMHASAEYRAHLISVFARRAITSAIHRA